jgi:predicted enzyme related to lactoylglutathione lyase
MHSAPALDYVVLTVPDVETSFTYLTETLGFVYEPEQSGPLFRQLVGSGGIRFGLLQAADDTPPPGSVSLYFSTPDLEGLRAAWSSAGVAASPIETKPFGRIFSVRSPDGNVLTMIDQPPV